MQLVLKIILPTLTLTTVLSFTTGTAGKPPSEGDGAYLVGDWIGESICVGNRPACHDEKVVYRIAKPPDETGKVIIAADKIVNGVAEEMGVLEFKYDSAKQTLTNEFTRGNTHGLWELTVKGDVMEGTLTILPDKTIGRRVKLKKEPVKKEQD